MEDIIADDEILESAANVDDCMMDMVEKGFGINAINGVVLARLFVLNREANNENDFFKFLTDMKQSNAYQAPKTLQ
jgi:phage gp29-like protein